MSLQNQKTSDAFGQYFDVLCEKTGLYANVGYPPFNLLMPESHFKGKTWLVLLLTTSGD